MPRKSQALVPGRKPGRPSLYAEVGKPHLDAIAGMAMRGLSVDAMSSALGIDRKTFYRWISTYSELREVVTKSRELATDQVENAMFKEATGYYVEEEVPNPKGGVVTVKRYMRPNVTAQIFWTKNRRPEEWADRRQVDHKLDVRGWVQEVVESSGPLLDLEQSESGVYKTSDDSGSSG